MSGGDLNYEYFRLEQLAENIDEKYIKTDWTYEEYDWLQPESITGNRPLLTIDILEGATPEQRAAIKKEVIELVETLRKTAKRAKELEWFVSGDNGIETYLNNLKEI